MIHHLQPPPLQAPRATVGRGDAWIPTAKGAVVPFRKIVVIASFASLTLMTACGSAEPGPDDAEAMCEQLEPRLGKGLRLGEYEQTLQAYADEQGYEDLYGLDTLMADACPELFEAADAVWGEDSDTVLGPAETEEPTVPPTKEAAPGDDGLSCEERYANAQLPIFTPEEQESLTMGVDVDCNPERVNVVPDDAGPQQDGMWTGVDTQTLRDMAEVVCIQLEMGNSVDQVKANFPDQISPANHTPSEAEIDSVVDYAVSEICPG